MDVAVEVLEEYGPMPYPELVRRVRRRRRIGPVLRVQHPLVRTGDLIGLPKK